MVASLIGLSLRHRAVVLAVAAGLLATGVYRGANMPVDVFPDLTAPRVTVVTESTGMAAEEVETLVTFPVETAINGAAGLRRVRSASAPGISVVWAEFDWQTSQTVARQRVTERLQTLAGALPAEAGAPLLAPSSSVMGEIAFVAVTSDAHSPMDLRRIVDVDVRRRLLAVDGVSQVVPIGGEVKQFQILVDAVRVEPFGLTLADVVDAVRRGSANAPGGYVVGGGQEAVVRVLGRAHVVEDLEAIVVAMRGDVPVRVRDVAHVEVGPAVARGVASYNAVPAVMLSVVKQPQADTVSTTRRLDAVLDGLVADLDARGVALHRDVFRQRDFIDNAIDNVVEVLRDGALLVVVVLFLFLRSARPTVISVVAIPLSLVAAVLVLDLFGLRIDTMTLGGLAIAIGELVDDAIVDVENVARRLRERAALPPERRRDTLATVLAASLEIRSAIVAATYVLMLVFVPLLMLGGLEGRLLRPLAVSYLAAIFASLIVAVTVTPVLCSYLLPKIAEREQREPPLIAWMVRRYRPVLRASLASPNAVLGIALAVVLAGVAGFAGLGRSFLPEFNEGTFTVGLFAPPGTSLNASDRMAGAIEKQILEIDGVRSVTRRTGRAERDEHAEPVRNSEMEITVLPGHVKEEVRSRITEALDRIPGITTNVGQPIQHRLSHILSGTPAAIAISGFIWSLMPAPPPGQQ